MQTEKDNLYFYKNFTNQTFMFISSKVAYFKKHLTIIVPLGNEISTTITCSILLLRITLIAGAMAEPFQT